MRTVILSALSCLSLTLSFSSPAAAQSNSAKEQLPESLSEKLSLSAALPLFPFHPQSGSANVANPGNESTSSSPNPLLKDKALAQLKRQLLETHPFALSSACAHIIIYVPPVTDTKMIIKVPGSDKVPEDAENGRAVPDLRAVPSLPDVASDAPFASRSFCREDLRRVDASHQAPPSSPDGKARLVPVQ